MNPSPEASVPAWYHALTQLMNEAESLGVGGPSSFYTQDGVLTMETSAGPQFDAFLEIGWADMGGGGWVKKSIVFNKEQPVEQLSIRFTDPVVSTRFTDPVAWLKEADKRKAEGHALVSSDDPVGRLVGFRDITTDEWLTITLPYLRDYGKSVRDEDKDWFLARMKYLKTPTGRRDYFAHPSVVLDIKSLFEPPPSNHEAVVAAHDRLRDLLHGAKEATLHPADGHWTFRLFGRDVYTIETDTERLALGIMGSFYGTTIRFDSTSERGFVVVTP